MTATNTKGSDIKILTVIVADVATSLAASKGYVKFAEAFVNAPKKFNNVDGAFTDSVQSDKLAVAITIDTTGVDLTKLSSSGTLTVAAGNFIFTQTLANVKLSTGKGALIMLEGAPLGNSDKITNFIKGALKFDSKQITIGSACATNDQNNEIRSIAAASFDGSATHSTVSTPDGDFPKDAIKLSAK